MDVTDASSVVGVTKGRDLTPRRADAFRARTEERFGTPVEPRATAPRVADFDLRPPRLRPPSSLATLFLDDPYERLLHAYGKSFPDAVRMFRREVSEPPDLVAYPETTEDVVRILDWAGDAGAAVIPFGGGSSVVGGVEPAVGGSYAGAVTIDLFKLDQVLEVDSRQPGSTDPGRRPRTSAGGAAPGTRADAPALSAELRALDPRRMDRDPFRRPLRQPLHAHRRLRRGDDDRHTPRHHGDPPVAGFRRRTVAGPDGHRF